MRALTLLIAVGVMLPLSAEAQPWRYEDGRGHVHYTNDFHQLPAKMQLKIQADRKSRGLKEIPDAARRPDRVVVDAKGAVDKVAKEVANEVGASDEAAKEEAKEKAEEKARAEASIALIKARGDLAEAEHMERISRTRALAIPGPVMQGHLQSATEKVARAKRAVELAEEAVKASQTGKAP